MQRERDRQTEREQEGTERKGQRYSMNVAINPADNAAATRLRNEPLCATMDECCAGSLSPDRLPCEHDTVQGPRAARSPTRQRLFIECAGS